MTGRAAPLGIAMATLVLFLVLGIVLIPWLDELLREAIARKEAAEAAATDNVRAAAARKTERQTG
ncbi:hypothetical protein MKK84_24575 [Methylobacterium sp. E-065]|uniref:hypothetical protein n=1 Tax=Methylobacterium sp. E-065 TaxID=2836583 RepID=UPI001FBBC040|nr:hypothetical protein [Methylobacterium sp. E-065]MCJ2020564.1 hypothetical protein [Methylobacterium sp. E-065]